MQARPKRSWKAPSFIDVRLPAASAEHEERDDRRDDVPTSSTAKR
jgi:hypothetical protein